MNPIDIEVFQNPAWSCIRTGGLRLLLALGDLWEVEDPSSYVARVDSIGQNTFVVFGANKSWIAIFFEQQKVNVSGCNFKGEPRRTLHSNFSGLHGLAVDVDLGLGTRGQKFVPDLFDLFLDFAFGPGAVSQLLNSQPKA